MSDVFSIGLTVFHSQLPPTGTKNSFKALEVTRSSWSKETTILLLQRVLAVKESFNVYNAWELSRIGWNEQNFFDKSEREWDDVLQFKPISQADVSLTFSYVAWCNISSIKLV